MFSYRLVLQYQGTGYGGWQIQPHCPTIQGELNSALKKMAKGEKIYSLGAGRTDAGVHALGQVARIDFPFKIEERALLRGLNSHLPRAIRILQSKQCSSHFDPIFQAEKKLYQYRFTLEDPPPVHLKDLIAYCPYKLQRDLLEKGCKLFWGEHDFRNFFTTGTPIKSTVRTLYSCTLEFIPSDSFWSQIYSGYYLLSFEGNGFLKQMVRLMVGTLWALGQRKISLTQLERALKNESQKNFQGNHLGIVAPAEGLYLAKVFYSDRSLNFNCKGLGSRL